MLEALTREGTRLLIEPTDPRPAWLLLRTKPKQERAVALALEGRGVKAYCPRVLEPRTHRRAPVGPVPLFPSYLFAHGAPRDSFRAIHFCAGAAGIVRFGDLIAAVEDEFIETLREREGDVGHLVLRDVRAAPRKGSRVTIAAGPFTGYEGLVERYLPARDRVRILLMLVGGTRRVELEARHVRSTRPREPVGRRTKSRPTNEG